MARFKRKRKIWSVVVPTNRPDRFQTFLDDWAELFVKHDVYLIVVQDTDEPFNYQPPNGSIRFYRGTIGSKCIPFGTDMIRSWGIYWAWTTGRKYTLTLDDDTRPWNDIFEAYEEVFEQGAPFSQYLDVGCLTSYHGQLRGFPFGDRKKAKVAVQFGGWNGVLDYDAPTQLEGVSEEEFFHPIVMPVPAGAAVTTCIMNAAWRTEYAPIMWQLPMLDGRYNRFGDIWAGLFAKKTLDRMGDVMVINGAAPVWHERASDPVKNMDRERPGIIPNEYLFRNLVAGYGDLLDVYHSVTESAADHLGKNDPEYAAHFRGARDEWLTLFR